MDMDYDELVAKVIDLLQREKRVPYRALKRRFDLDDDYIEDLKDELIEAKQLAKDENGKVLVWLEGSAESTTPTPIPVQDQKPPPISYTPQYLTEKILTSRSALEGERKVVTVLFADIKDSTELIKDLDPEDAQKLLDPAIHIMMDAVHRFEGTVNQVLGDGIMALFGAPIAHEDHALRACYAALAMQTAMQPYADEVRRTHGIAMRIRVGLNAGEVVVRLIRNDLHMDYSAVGHTTHLAARMEQLAAPGSIMLSAATLRLVEGFVQVNALGPVPVKGMPEPVEVCELVGVSDIRRRLQASMVRGLTRFVGRDREMAALHQTLQQAGAGHGQVVAVVGEAGVGKSRLVYECVQSPHASGWRVLESASVSYGKATPYFPVTDLLKRYCQIDNRDDPRSIRAKVTGHILTLDETLQETIPALLSLLDVLPDESPFLALDPQQRRHRTLEGLKRVLLRESQVQSLLLVFEDLHWIDSETQALLESLIESLPTAQLLLLVNYRPEYRHTWGNKTTYTQLRLDPLPPASAEELLQALLGNDPSLAPLKHLLIDRTAGNPFFLEECVRALVETQVLVGDQGSYRLVQSVEGLTVPATVQAILAARIDRLPLEEKRLLQTAAVIGPEVPLALLQAVTDGPDEALLRDLTHLQRAEFLYETRLFPDRAYTFKHALTQQVAYESLLSHTRQQSHERIAQALEAQFPETVASQPELLAHHCTEAGLYEQAVGYWQRAGERANRRSAYVEAVAHLRKGLEILTRLPETPERIQQELTLHLTLGPVLRNTLGYAAPEVEHTYARAHEIFQQVGESPQHFQMLWGLGSFYLNRLELQTARELGEQLLSAARRQDDAGPLVIAHTMLGFVCQLGGELVQSRAYLEQGLAFYDPQQHHALAFRYGQDPGVASLGFLALTLWYLGYPDQARQKSHEACTLAQELSHPFSLAHALSQAALVHRYRRDVNATQACAEALLALASEHELTYMIATAKVMQGWVLIFQGESASGIARARQGITQATEPRWRFEHALLAEAYARIGQADEGLRLLAEPLPLLDKMGGGRHRAELHRLQGEVLLQRAVPNELQAEACFHQALDVARHQQAKSWELRAATSLARLWQCQDKRQEAYDLLAPVYNWFSEGFDTADLQEAKALLDELA